MSEDLYELYKEDQDFKVYVDTIAKSKGINIFEAFCLKIIKSYAEYLLKLKEDKK